MHDEHETRNNANVHEERERSETSTIDIRYESVRKRSGIGRKHHG